MPSASAAHAPTSTRVPDRPPLVTTGRQELPSFNVPAGHAGPPTQTPAPASAPASALASALASARNLVPRGQVASRGTQADRPSSTIGIVAPSHAIAPPRGSDALGTHAPVTASRSSVALHERNAHPAPLPPACAAGPQKASATAGGTQAPTTSTSPSAPAHRPVESTAASRGHAAAASRGHSASVAAPAPAPAPSHERACAHPTGAEGAN